VSLRTVAVLLGKQSPGARRPHVLSRERGQLRAPPAAGAAAPLRRVVFVEGGGEVRHEAVVKNLIRCQLAGQLVTRRVVEHQPPRPTLEGERRLLGDGFELVGEADYVHRVRCDRTRGR